MRAVALLGGALLTAAVVAGCSTSTAGTASPAGAASTSAAVLRLAPLIPQPLDASSYAARPCDLVTPAQLARLGISKPGKREDQITGPGCNWRPDDFSNIEYAAVIDTGARGLESLYQRRATFQVFEPVTVAGYPAVHADHYDARSRGNCPVLVGINETTTIDVISDVGDGRSADYTNACRSADAFATMIIGNLRGGS